MRLKYGDYGRVMEAGVGGGALFHQNLPPFRLEHDGTPTNFLFVITSFFLESATS